MDLAKDGCLSDIETLGRDVRKQQNKQEASIGRLRDMVGNTLKDQIVDSMRQVPPPPLRYNEGELLKKKKTDDSRPDIRKAIATHVAEQVQRQVEMQIKDHLPVDLERQANDCKTQLEKVQRSVDNS